MSRVLCARHELVTEDVRVAALSRAAGKHQHLFYEIISLASPERLHQAQFSQPTGCLVAGGAYGAASDGMALHHRSVRADLLIARLEASNRAVFLLSAMVFLLLSFAHRYRSGECIFPLAGLPGVSGYHSCLLES